MTAKAEILTLSYRKSAEELSQKLGISPDYPKKRGLPFQEQATELVFVEMDLITKTDQFLEPAAAKAWWEMKATAQKEGIELSLNSGFRSIEVQAGIIEGELAKGESLEKALTWIAAPGYSEHHTGRALDICTFGSTEINETFDLTEEYRWLSKNAGRYGFRLSYPRGNPYQIIYEPWHWFFIGNEQK